jgi:hypothetical protein
VSGGEVGGRGLVVSVVMPVEIWTMLPGVEGVMHFWRAGSRDLKELMRK